MNYSDKSERLLKYQKAKAKLIEYDVPKAAYPHFPLNSYDLSLSSVYILSLYAESLIENNSKSQAELRPLLEKTARYFDAAFESREQLQHDQDFLITGASAYFLYNDFGCAKVLCSKADSSFITVSTPFQLLALCLCFLLSNKIYRFTSDAPYCTEIYRSLISYFSTGEEVSGLMSQLNQYRKFIFENGNASDNFYVDILYAVVAFAIQKSAWQLLPQYSGISIDVWKGYLGRHEAVKILWQSQELLCSQGVLLGNNAIVQLPTGVGKTKSIELMIRAACLSNRTTEIIIVAPLRALCNEISHDLQYAFVNDNAKINQFSDVLEDDYSFGLMDSRSIHISICTPEKLNYIIHHQPDVCDMVGLFIFDEAHMFDDGSRGISYEFLITTIRDRIKENQQLVLLSAVMTNADDIRQWLFGSNGIVATNDSIISTPKSIGFCNSENVAYYSGDPLTQDYFVPLDIKTTELRLFGNERKSRIFPMKNNPRDIALYYGIRLCKNGGVAVYVDQTASVRTTVERMIDIQKRGYCLDNITQKNNTIEMAKIQQFISKYYGENHAYTVGCNCGILPHHSKLPNGVKLAIEYALREKSACFVVCTSTLAQGVNIPIKYLLMTSIIQRNPQVKVRSFQNLIGRTARAGMYTEGSILITNPSLYNQRNTYKGGGKYRWKECCEMFSKSKAEPCTSSLLLPVSDIHIGYEGTISAQWIVDYILMHYNGANCFDELEKMIKTGCADEGHPLDNNGITDINYQLLQRKQVLETIENHLCFVCGIMLSSDHTVLEEVCNDICKKTLAYYLADEDKKSMLLSIFQLLGKNVASLSKQQHMKFSAAMTSIDHGKVIEAWIAEIDLVNHFYNESDLLQLLVSLYCSLFRPKMNEDDLLYLCQEWINGRMPMEILADLPFTDIDQLMDACHKNISYELSFLVGNIIDLLPSTDDEHTLQELIFSLSLLQRKLKYGVPNLTAISICESVFWDRSIAIKISQIIQNDTVSSTDLDVHLNYYKDQISAYLEQMPTYFISRFSTVLNKSSNT